MTSLALPDAARRESPDHHALLRVSGEKSDMVVLLVSHDFTNPDRPVRCPAFCWLCFGFKSLGFWAAI
jgi:hypothetical protein